MNGYIYVKKGPHFIDFHHWWWTFRIRNIIRLELSHSAAARHNFTIFQKSFSHSLSLFLSVFRLSLRVTVFFRLAKVYSATTLGRQTSINDCLPRNIDDLTNSKRIDTLCLYIRFTYTITKHTWTWFRMVMYTLFAHFSFGFHRQ